MNALRDRLRSPVVIVVAVVAAFALGTLFAGGERVSSDEHVHREGVSEWTCSMHPQIRLPEPGACPICGMDLVPVESGARDEGEVASLTLSARAARLAEVVTEPARREPVARTIRTVGRLAADERRMRAITAWVPGRIERLHVDFTGARVGTGDPLYEIYSPDLLAAAEELVQASRMAAAAPGGTSERTARGTLEAARARLRLWGLSPAQIVELESGGAIEERTTIRAPVAGTVTHKAVVAGDWVKAGAHVYSIVDLSSLWLLLDAYESDLPWVRKGQRVTFVTDAIPGRSFEGTIVFVDPTVDPKTRTLGLRADVPNESGVLMPGLFARASIRSVIDEIDGATPLSIPASASLVTGKRAVVYVAVPGEPGRYEGREVTLGPRADDRWIVVEGLDEGERVVVNGAFKIDSELEIRGAPSMMNPERGTWSESGAIAGGGRSGGVKR